VGAEHIPVRDIVWALGSCCALSGKPFEPQLLLQQHPPPYTSATLVIAARSLGFRASAAHVPVDRLAGERGNIVLLDQPEEGQPALGLLLQVDGANITWIPAGSRDPVTDELGAFAQRYTGELVQVQRQLEGAADPDQANVGTGFGFGWFVPELLKHRKVWRDVLGASLILQLLALGLPLFTQAIIDKVVVHQTESTLVAIAIGMAIFMVATAILTWVRQYLVLHTGNRVDAVLAATVFDHLFKLPPRYFQHRPTGVVAARLHGVETIREFVSSAAVTLVLDIPFLLIAVAVMFYYSVPLTLVALGVLAVIAVISILVAPVFQQRLNEQFMLGARNQAFLTEYIAGFETVKSLQFEPQLKSRYSEYLATYLNSGFHTKQIGNTYNVAATTLEQIMTLMILLGGAWLVMHPTPGSKDIFTIGMLVAFQMFAGKLSQPLMRLVGLWQQFQQARLAVLRLGDLMNAPAEPYSLTPSRQGQGEGRIEIEGVSFRYGDDRPYLYEDLSLAIQPGKTVAIMGPSGSGKSTLAKLLQGFYWPSAGQIRIDGIDIRHLSSNELRANFGVVPQETVLFSGTIYENLMMANAHATFEQVVQACKMAEIHAAIEALPQGYQTPIGERGAGLSGGQKQRLAIARALLKRPKILIFDEATSALDADTAEQFAKTINALKGKVTMLFITHALPRSLRIDEVVQVSRQGARQLHAVPPDRSDAGKGTPVPVPN
jgi:ATP-binding cassette, subfamily B, bacterial HlyB/CyaB